MRFAQLNTGIAVALAVFCLSGQAQAVACGFDCEATIDKQNGRFYLPNARFGIATPETQPFQVVGVG